VAVLLVRVRNSVRQVAVLLDLPFHGVGRDSHTRVAVGPIDNATATGVSAQPKQAVVHLGHRVWGNAANLVKSALDALQWEVQRACVVPDLN